MRRPAPTNCPVCGTSLKIARLECTDCHTAIEGDFDRGRLGRLSREQLAFVEVFLEARGKIKDVEQQLGLSYPTVVSRLDQVVEALGARGGPTGNEGGATGADGDRRKRIDTLLESVARGDITPADAAEKIRAARGSKGEPK